VRVAAAGNGKSRALPRLPFRAALLSEARAARNWARRTDVDDWMHRKQYVMAAMGPPRYTA